jgi:hypothetical protein
MTAKASLIVMGASVRPDFPDALRPPKVIQEKQLP